jgi:hypothetical protein
MDVRFGGLLTGRGNRWTQERVTSLRSHHAIPCYDADKCEAEGWMNLTKAANTLGLNPRTLRLAAGSAPGGKKRVSRRLGSRD